MIIGKISSNEVVWQGFYDGGKRETALANQFISWAEQIEDQWFQTGNILRQIGKNYARDARSEDASAEGRADKGREKIDSCGCRARSSIYEGMDRYKSSAHTNWLTLYQTVLHFVSMDITLI